MRRRSECRGGATFRGLGEDMVRASSQSDDGEELHLKPELRKIAAMTACPTVVTSARFRRYPFFHATAACAVRGAVIIGPGGSRGRARASPASAT